MKLPTGLESSSPTDLGDGGSSPPVIGDRGSSPSVIYIGDRGSSPTVGQVRGVAFPYTRKERPSPV